MSIKNLALRILLVTVVLVACAAAQSDFGTISGYVKDPSGATIPGAKVTLRNQSGTERQTTTNASGYYVVTNLPPGVYTLVAEAQGFKKAEASENKLDPSANLGIDTVLQVGSTAETVEVVASAAVLQTESASVQKLITRQQIDSLELSGRNPVNLAVLVPGARGGAQNGLSFNFGQGPANFNGSRNPENLITYDGAPATRTRSNGTSLGAADVDATSEVQILTANYAAEYGRTSGAQIRIVTKSGTQQFHGAAFEYLQNTALNANSWSRNANTVTDPRAATNFTAPVHYNQWGFNFGGPFFIPGKFNTDKRKFFFFVGEEWTKYHFTDSSTMQVPTALMRKGNFSELLGANPFYSTPQTIKDPLTGLAFPGNVIPTARLAQLRSSDGTAGLLNAYPDPIVNPVTPGNFSNFLPGGVNWFAYALHPQDQRKDTLSVDMIPTDKQHIAFRRLGYHFVEYQPLDGGSGRTPKFFNRPNQTTSLDHVWTISPTFVNELLATVSLDDVYIPVDAAHFYDRTQAGLNYGYIFPAGKLIPTRIPTINMNNFSGLSGGPYPSHSAGPIYDLSDSITKVHGNHTFKAGFIWERSGQNDNDEINVSACPTCTNNQNGQFSFTNGRTGGTGVAAANAALGLFDSYSELGQRGYTIFRANMYEWFVQDSWKVTNKLHLDLGLRHTIIVPYSALWRNMAVFAPELYDPAKAVKLDPKTGQIIPGSGDPYNGMVLPGSGFPDSAKGRVPTTDVAGRDITYLFRGVNSHYSDVQKADFGPRVGLAYQVSEKTVLRAGIGRYFTRLGVSDSIFLGGNPPFQPTVNITNGNVANIGTTGANSLPLVVTTQSKAFKPPEAWTYNVTVERQMFWNTTLSLAYVGRRGLHLQRESNIDQPAAGTIQRNPGVAIDALRPYLGYSSIRETDNVASSRYNSFQLNWVRRFTHGSLFNFAYTYSKSMDDGSNQRDIIPNTYNAKNLWGASEFDVRHVAVINYIYTLPFFRDNKNWSGKLLGGWQISGLTQFSTGTPCSVGVSTDYAGTGPNDGSWGCGSGVGGELWNINGTPKLVKQFAKGGGSADPAQWYTVKNPDGTPIFTAPAAGTFTTQNVRDILYNPGFSNWNLGLFKEFAVNERSGFQFRAESYDVWNHPNWSGISSLNPTNSNFGKVTSKTQQRSMQLSLRYHF